MNKKELIEDLVLHYNEITTSDLQGVVMAWVETHTKGEKDILTIFKKSDLIIAEIEKEFEKRNKKIN